MPTPTGTSIRRHPYSQSAGGLGAFTYTPVIARLFAPFASLPWYSFLWLWTAVLVATLVWLGWRSSLVVLAFPPVALELYHGNVHLLIAAAIVARLPLAGDLGVHPPDQGDARRRPDLVRRPARVAEAGDRPRCDRGPRRDLARLRRLALAGLADRRHPQDGDAAPRSTSSRSRSRSGSACRRPPSSWPGAAGPIAPGRSPWRPPSPCRSCGRRASRSWPPCGRSSARRPGLTSPDVVLVRRRGVALRRRRGRAAGGVPRPLGASADRRPSVGSSSHGRHRRGGASR